MKGKSWKHACQGGTKQCSRSAVLGGMLVLLTLLPVAAGAFETTGREIVEKCFDYMRGKASVAELEMTIHRPDWKRSMSIKVWTKGEKKSFFVITSPARDKGNATLKKGREMWMFNPKVNRVIKLPPSMMSQAWLGSDFSNNDLSKTDSLKLDYEHTILGTEKQGDGKVYLIQSMPKPGAPVVWGMQKLRIREDGIMLEETFFDEDMEPVKKLSMSEIEMMGGRLYPSFWKMEQSDKKGHYTTVAYKSLEFKASLPSRYFTLSNLRNPRR